MGHEQDLTEIARAQHNIGILEILSIRDSKIDRIPTGLFITGATPAQAFIDAAEFERDSLLSQFAIVSYAEGIITSEIIRRMRSNRRGALSSSTEDEIVGLQTFQGEIRRVKKELDSYIFVGQDDDENYGQLVLHAITRGRTGAVESVRRRADHKVLGDEIRKKFPRASKIVRKKA